MFNFKIANKKEFRIFKKNFFLNNHFKRMKLISRKKMVSDVLYRTYGRKWNHYFEDEDCWFDLHRCFRVSSQIGVISVIIE